MKKVCFIAGLCVGLATQVGAQDSGALANTESVVVSPAEPAFTVLTQAQIDALIAQCEVSATACAAATEALLSNASVAGLSPDQLAELAVSVTGALVLAAVSNPDLQNAVGATVSRLGNTLAALNASPSPALRSTLSAVGSLVIAGRAGQVDLTAVALVTRTVQSPPSPPSPPSPSLLSGGSAPSGGQNASPS